MATNNLESRSAGRSTITLRPSTDTLRGAEDLTAVGDALFRAPGNATLMKVSTPYVSDAEVGRLTTHYED